MSIAVDMVKGAFMHYNGDPESFCYDIMGVRMLSEDQKKVLKAFNENKRIAVPAGHSTGKTGLEALITNYWLATRMKPRVIVTAPTYRQLQYVYYAEVSKWYNKSLMKPLDIFQLKNNIMHINDEELKKEWYMLPISPKSPDSLQGQHGDKSALVDKILDGMGIEVVEDDEQLKEIMEKIKSASDEGEEEDLLVIIEEGSGVDQKILEVLEGTDYGKICMFGNMTKTTGMFYDVVYRYCDKWKVVRMSSYNSPFMSHENINYMEVTYGKDSNVVRVRLKGLAPDSENDTVISRDNAEACIDITVNEENIPESMKVDPKTKYVGNDVARFGDDNTVTYTRETYYIEDTHIVNKKDTMKTVGKISNICRENEGIEIEARIDGVGVGGGVIDRLNELIDEDRENVFDDLTVIEIHNNGEPLNKKEYFDWITEGFFELKKRIDAKALSLPDDPILIEDLCGRKYGFHSDGRLKIESKDKFKERFGRSPDRGDAFVQCWKITNKFWIV